MILMHGCSVAVTISDKPEVNGKGNVGQTGIASLAHNLLIGRCIARIHRHDFGCVVEDGTGFRRFLNERLLDPATAAQAAKEAVLDRELGEVREPEGVLEAMMEIDGVPRVAVAAALREV